MCFSQRRHRGPKGTLANRVRVLTIWPCAVRDALGPPTMAPTTSGTGRKKSHERVASFEIIRRSKELWGSSISPSPSSSTPYPSQSSSFHLPSSIRSSISLASNPKSTPPIRWVIPPAYNSSTPLPTPPQRLSLFTSTVSSLTSTTECHIHWYVDTAPQGIAWTFPHFHLIWKSVGLNLTILSIDAQVSVMGSMLREAQEATQKITGGWLFPVLEELDVVLRCENPANLTFNTPEQRELHLRQIMHFIIRLSPSLKSLSLKTIGHTDLSFLGSLGKLPVLTKLSLIVPLDNRHLKSPESVKQFLHNHPKVRELCVRYARCCWDPDEDGFCVPGGTATSSRVSSSLTVTNTNRTMQTKHQSKSRSASVNFNMYGSTTNDSNSGAGTHWQHLIYTGVSLPTLHSLTLGVHLPLPSSLPTLTALSLLPSAHTLTTLVLKDRSLTLSEARSLLFLHRGNGRSGVGTFSYGGGGGAALHGCRNLRRLSMFARKLSPQLVDLVASACPVLSVWEIDVGAAVASDREEEGSSEGSKVKDDVVSLSFLCILHFFSPHILNFFNSPASARPSLHTL